MTENERPLWSVHEVQFPTRVVGPPDPDGGPLMGRLGVPFSDTGDGGWRKPGPRVRQ